MQRQMSLSESARNGAVVQILLLRLHRALYPTHPAAGLGGGDGGLLPAVGAGRSDRYIRSSATPWAAPR
jgi:hypothetical protein